MSNSFFLGFADEIVKLAKDLKPVNFMSQPDSIHHRRGPGNPMGFTDKYMFPVGKQTRPEGTVYEGTQVMGDSKDGGGPSKNLGNMTSGAQDITVPRKKKDRVDSSDKNWGTEIVAPK